MNDIKIMKNNNPKEKSDKYKSGDFGKFFTDHMFLANYNERNGWHNPMIVPYAPLTLSPASLCFQYAQEAFDDLKAYRSIDNSILLFRPADVVRGFNNSLEKLCIPKIDENFLIEAIKELVNLDKDWIGREKGDALYIRPFVIATEASLEFRSSSEFTLCVVCSPVESNVGVMKSPIKIKAEGRITGCVNGSLGDTKSGASYAMLLKAKNLAFNEGFKGVLWLDSIDRKFIESISGMNAFFVIDNDIITPELYGSAVSGITRDSVIDMLKGWGYNVSERRISLNEVERAYMEGRLKEVFATNTRFNVLPVGAICVGSRELSINENQTGKIARRVYNNLTLIQCGDMRDNMKWMSKVL